MKKIIIFYFIVIFSQVAFGQNITLSKLIEMAECKNLSDFDLKARAEGYKFNSEHKYFFTANLYTKKIKIEDYIFTFSLYYDDYHNQKPTIDFIASSTALPNLITEIKSQATFLGFFETRESPEKTTDSVTFYYKNGIYKLKVSDVNKGDHNSFIISIIHL